MKADPQLLVGLVRDGHVRCRGVFEGKTSMAGAIIDVGDMKAALPQLQEVGTAQNVLLANMTEFGRTPVFTASEFEAMGYAMAIWPVSSLRVANKAQERLYAALREEGKTARMLPEMQTRTELYGLISLAEFEALDASVARSIAPAWSA